MSEPYTPDGSKVTYTVPSLDDPADGPQAFRDFADSIPPGLSAAIPIRVKDADYTLALDDEGAGVFFDTTAESHKVTVPAHADVAFPIGTAVVIGNVGTNKDGNVQITPADGVTVRDTSVRKVGLNRMAVLLQVEQDSWIINAGTGGGPAPGSVPSPPKLTAAIGGPECAYLNWEAPKDDGGHEILTYVIERSTDNVNWQVSATTTGAELSTQVTGLAVGVAVSLRVKASNIIGLSEPSNVLQATPVNDYNSATGGDEVSTYTKDGRTYRVHTFKKSGTLTINKSAVPFKVLVVGGGGGGGVSGAYCGSGGGGAGGLIYDPAISLPAGAVPVVVGAGASGAGGNGQDSKLGASLTAVGGGGGGQGSGQAGGSGGGAGGGGGSGGKGVSGQGFDGGPGGDSNYKRGSGGGGAGEVGQPYSTTSNGGSGRQIDITGTPTFYAGGGGGGSSQGAQVGAGGAGGGGAGGWPPGDGRGGPQAGAANTGGGGGGGGGSNGGAGPTGAPGGSGIVIVSYEIAPYNDAKGGTETYYSESGKFYKVHTFTSTSTLTVNSAAAPFRVLAVAAGANGSTRNGGAGGKVVESTVSLTLGQFTATVGVNGNQLSSLGDKVIASGPGASGGIAKEGRDVWPGQSGTASTITGASVIYGGGGGTGGPGSGYQFPGQPGGAGGAGGGGKGGGGGFDRCDGCGGGNFTDGTAGGNGLGGGGGGGGTGEGAKGPYLGGSGVVIVSYEVASAPSLLMDRATWEEQVRMEQGEV